MLRVSVKLCRFEWSGLLHSISCHYFFLAEKHLRIAESSKIAIELQIFFNGRKYTLWIFEKLGRCTVFTLLCWAIAFAHSLGVIALMRDHKNVILVDLSEDL